MELLRLLMKLLWLVAVYVFLRVRNACLRWRLRLRGIDMDSFPEVQELRRRRDEERRKLRKSWKQLRADARSRSRRCSSSALGHTGYGDFARSPDRRRGSKAKRRAAP